MRTLRMDGFRNSQFTFYLTWNQFAKKYVSTPQMKQKTDYPLKSSTNKKKKKKSSSLKQTNLQHLHSNSIQYLNVWFSSHFQFPKEAEIENLQLLIQFHSNNAVFTINTEQDSCGLPVLSQNHLHLKTTHVFISEKPFF